MATRLYFPYSGTAPASPAFASGWEGVTAPNFGQQRLPLVTTPTNSTSSGPGIVTPPAVTAPVDALYRQFVSAPLPAGPVSGTFTLVVACSQNGSLLDSFLQAIIRVVSGDGSTVRGTLYAGQPAAAASASTSSPAYEFVVAAAGAANTARTRILTDTLASVTATAGDRLVVEVGARAISPNGTTRSLTMVFIDSALTDFPATVDLAGDVGRPWVEFSQNLFPPATGNFLPLL